MSHRRTQRTIKLVVETKDTDPESHDRVVRWAQKNIIEANWNMKDTFVSLVILDEKDNVVSFTGNGTPSPETEEIIKDLVDDI